MDWYREYNRDRREMEKELRKQIGNTILGIPVEMLAEFLAKQRVGFGNCLPIGK